MLTRFRHLLHSPVAHWICLEGVFGLLLILLLPCVIDWHDHEPGTASGAQTHYASCLDLVSLYSFEAGSTAFPGTIADSLEGSRSPTKRFLITSTSSSYL